MVKRNSQTSHIPQNGDISALTEQLCALIESLPIDEKVAQLNDIRQALHQISPFRSEPVDCVVWVPADSVVANDYNPNKVASTEMDLLHLSIKNDGFTQPIVAFADEDYMLVVDGFHRNLVGKTRKDIRERLYGYLPITKIDKSLQDRMVSTVRHNRARGKHVVDLQSELVSKLLKLGLADSEIAKQLGMSGEEVLRLKQQVRVADLLANDEYGKTWEFTEK